MTKLAKCKYCGAEAHGEWGSIDYRVECSNTNGCKAWPRVYAKIKKYAEESWNDMMEVRLPLDILTALPPRF